MSRCRSSRTRFPFIVHSSCLLPSLPPRRRPSLAPSSSRSPSRIPLSSLYTLQRDHSFPVLRPCEAVNLITDVFFLRTAAMDVEVSYPSLPTGSQLPYKSKLTPSLFPLHRPTQHLVQLPSPEVSASPHWPSDGQDPIPAVPYERPVSPSPHFFPRLCEYTTPSSGPGICRLPDKLLGHISFLACLDDVFRLSLTCSRMYKVFVSRRSTPCCHSDDSSDTVVWLPADHYFFVSYSYRVKNTGDIGPS